MSTTVAKSSMKAANCLMLAFRDTCPEAERNLFGQNGSATRVADSGVRFNQTDISNDSITRALRWLLPHAQDYPEEKLRDRLAKEVVESRSAGTQIENAVTDLQARLLRLLAEVSVTSEWLVLMVVRGVAVDSNPISVGGVEFTRMTPDQFRLWGRRVATGTENPPISAGISAYWNQQHSAMLDQAVGTTKVNASDFDHALHRAKKKIAECFDLLRYGMLFLEHTGQPIPQFGVGQPLGGIVYPQQNVCFRLGDPATQTSLSIANASGATLDPADITPGWRQLEEILESEAPPSEMKRRIVTALRWIGQAILSESNSLRIVCYVTAMESLFLLPSESAGKRRKLKERIARLPQIPTCDVHFGEDRIEEAYKSRCRCVHDGDIDATKHDERTAFNIAVQCFHGLLCEARFRQLETLVEVLTEMGIDLENNQKEDDQDEDIQL